MNNPELTDPAAARSCLCPNGHGQMKAVYGPDAPGAPSNWTWECAVCGIERMWPDEGEKSKPAAARFRPAQPEKGDEEKNLARVAPSVPCVAPTGSTAEPRTGAVTAAKVEKWASENKRPIARFDPPTDWEGRALKAEAELAALAAARLALQQQPPEGWSGTARIVWNELLDMGVTARDADALVSIVAGHLQHADAAERSLAACEAHWREYKARADEQRHAAEAARTALRQLVEEEIRAHDAGPNAAYCWWCNADINGQNGPVMPHEPTCWRIRAEAACAGDLADRLARAEPKEDEKERE